MSSLWASFVASGVPHLPWVWAIRQTLNLRRIEKSTELTGEKSLQAYCAATEPFAGQPAPDRRVVLSEKFPKVLGPYSHAVVAGGFVFVAGRSPSKSVQPACFS